MEMETGKIKIVLAENVAKSEVVIREGAAVKELELKAPIKTKLSGVIGAPVEYLRKRLSTGQFTQSRAHLLVNREEVSLQLVINEDDEYLRGVVEGKLELHPKFVALGINAGKLWTPKELGLFFKMNRALFTDKFVNMKLVTELMSFIGSVNSKIESSAKENGSVTDNFEKVVTSNLPASFTLRIPVFKGMSEEMLEVETFAKVDGRDVSLVLISPGATLLLEEIRNNVIDSQLEQVSMIAPDIAIIEV
jgi:hypothetical protein